MQRGYESRPNNNSRQQMPRKRMLWILVVSLAGEGPDSGRSSVWMILWAARPGQAPQLATSASDNSKRVRGVMRHTQQPIQLHQGSHLVCFSSMHGSACIT